FQGNSVIAAFSITSIYVNRCIADLFRNAGNKLPRTLFRSAEEPMQNNRTPSQLDAPATSDEAQLSPHDGGPGDGIDRRNFLSCMAWAGTGLLWSIAGGVPVSKLVSAKAATPTRAAAGSSFSFVQISDSHIGFNKAANQDVTGTLKLAIDKINGLSARPDLLLHTGDITQSSKVSEFDTAQQVIRSAKAGETFYVPGEHDTATDDGALY